MKKDWFQGITDKGWFAYTLAACSAVLLYMILSKFDVITGWFHGVLQFLSPIIVGVVIAYILNPPTVFFERLLARKIRHESACHTLAVVLSILVFFCIISIIFVAVIPYAISNIVSLGMNADNYTALFNNALSFLDKLTTEAGVDIDELLKSVSETLNNNVHILPSGIKAAWDTSMTVGSAMMNTVIGFIIAVYLMLDKKRICKTIDRLRRALLSEETYLRNTSFWQHCNYVFIRYVIFSLVDACIIGTANMCFMSLMKMPYIALVSVLVALTNILPTIGPLIGALLGALILVINRPITAVWFLLFTLVLQTLDAYVIKPRLFGSSLGIPPVLTLIAIILGGKLFGIIGIFLSIPVMSVICDLYSSSLLPRLEKRKSEADSPEKPDENTEESPPGPVQEKEKA